MTNDAFLLVTFLNIISVELQASGHSGKPKRASLRGTKQSHNIGILNVKIASLRSQ